VFFPRGLLFYEVRYYISTRAYRCGGRPPKRRDGAHIVPSPHCFPPSGDHKYSVCEIASCSSTSVDKKETFGYQLHTGQLLKSVPLKKPNSVILQMDDFPRIIFAFQWIIYHGIIVHFVYKNKVW